MKILVTNDDGIGTVGIRSLSRALQSLGRVTVVAPLHEQSAVSRSITFRSPLRVEELDAPIAGSSFAVSGTPTDCVFLAVHHLLDELPDLVVSGINTGPNLGDDVLYSGTVAGALEGSLNGIPSIALSLGAHGADNYDTAASWLVSFLRENPLSLPQRTCLNINVPPGESQDFKGWRYTAQGRTNYGQKVIERLDTRGQKYYWLGGDLPAGRLDDGSDSMAISENFVSVTPLGLDLTDHHYLNKGVNN